MSDIKLFRFLNDSAEVLPGRTVMVERELHDLMEKHMECFLGVRFVAHEYSTGRVHRGRIDSLGLDENNCPVILEYKRQSNENVINQGLYYLDWLLDHQAEFKLLVLDRYGRETADAIQWYGTRVLCIAADFTKFDEHAVAQIGRNIELIRYKYFGTDLLLLEWVNPAHGNFSAISIPPSAPTIMETAQEVPQQAGEGENTGASVLQRTAMSDEQRILYEELCSFILSLGDDIIIKELQRYVAFTRLRNFACLAPMRGWFKLWLHLNPDSVSLEEGFSRDVRSIGHWGTGDLEVALHSLDEMNKLKPLIERAYMES